jgi:regulator of protease activity HflC (stomatin/prohibitin superfamily)
MEQKSAGHGAAGILTLLTLGVMRFFVVEQGYVRPVMAFGRLIKITSPGLQSCLSFWNLYQGPGEPVPTSEQIVSYDGESVFTSDGVGYEIDVMICYNISDPERALFQVNNFKIAIENLVKSVLRNECGKLPARAMLSSREQMARGIQETLLRDCAPWGISIRLVEIKNIKIVSQERNS